MLEVCGLEKTYRGGIVKKRAVRAVDHVSFRLEAGKTFGIVGNSGCGKSTIARILLSLVRPDGGQVTLDGVDVLHAPPAVKHELTKKIQIIFQHPESSLDPSKTLLYSLREPLLVHPLYPAAQREARVRELLRMVELPETLLDRYPHQVSGGEAQRVMIARALTLDPKVLILDEPTNMLDVSIQAQVLTLLRELQARLQLSYLFISHDIGVVQWFCDDLAVMQSGRFVETGRTEDVIRSPRHPFTQELLSCFHFG